MTNEYISRDDAIRLAEQGQVQGFPWQFQMLVRLPPADVVPVVHGKWTKLSYDGFNCNECGSTFVIMQGRENMHFCPNCGAKMDGHREE